MININRERKCPLGEVLNFTITIKNVTILIDAIVMDATTYSAIVGNDWLSKVKANIDYETSTMIIHWQGKEIEIPIEYLELPSNKWKRTNGGKIVKINEDEEEESEESDNPDDDEEYEEEELEEKVFCHFKVKRKSQESPNDDKPIRLDCRFDDVVISGIYPKENIIIVNDGVYLDDSYYTWDYFRRLNEQFGRQPTKKARWVYDWKGPSARCWCNERLYSPSDSCYQCQGDLVNYITLKQIPPEIVGEMSSGTDFDYGPPSAERRQQESIPETYQQVELKKIADDQDRRNCFYCGRKSHLEWEERNEAFTNYAHAELENIEKTGFDNLSIGELMEDRKIDLIKLLNQYWDIFAWESLQLGQTNWVQHGINVGDATPIKK